MVEKLTKATPIHNYIKTAKHTNWVVKVIHEPILIIGNCFEQECFGNWNIQKKRFTNKNRLIFEIGK
ncbi:MAG: hypothetical protein OXH65_08220 [Paracoccaceae bacterium]|nr:hypothetical protein [Paracoccaceae bacterium]MDE2675076.1 hypothetical protein [Paracoccaceae bacterium]